ncbi:hypothetical protein RQP46_005304 [Phenoliferia psychrophenolica]
MDKDIAIPGVLFAIPFPPTDVAPNPDKPRPSFLLYAPPRAGYIRPASPSSPSDKPVKESFTKKMEAKWQGEVAEGQAIASGSITDATKWQRAKGAVARNAQKVIQYLPSSDIEALSRVPPGKKMHEAIIFTPEDASLHGQTEVEEAEKAHQQQRTNEAPGEKELDAQLLATKKKAVKKTVISGVLLPITGAFDWICPIFSFEVDVAYFSSQLQGLRKATALTGSDVHLSLQPSPHLSAVTAHLQAICFELSPHHFKRGPLGASAVTSDLAAGIILQFQQAVSPEVAARHVLDPKVISEDLERCMRKGAKEFVKAL